MNNTNIQKTAEKKIAKVMNFDLIVRLDLSDFRQEEVAERQLNTAAKVVIKALQDKYPCYGEDPSEEKLNFLYESREEVEQENKDLREENKLLREKLREASNKIQQLKYRQSKVEDVMKDLEDMELTAFPAGRIYKKADIKQVLKKYFL